MMEIKAVIFDIGGVLMCPKRGSPKKGQFSKAAHRYMAEHLGFTLEKWRKCVKGPIKKSEKGLITKSQVLKRLAEILNTPGKHIEHIFKTVYKMSYPSNRLMHKFAFDLKKKGYKIAILSNQWHISKEALIPKTFSKKFDAVVVSCDVKTEKPGQRIYKLIIKKLNLKAKECVFIDNASWNLKPARKLGMNVILFKNNKQLFNDLKKLGVK